MQHIYFRDDQGLIHTESAKDWTRDTYLQAHPDLEFAHSEPLAGWPDIKVDWYAVGGDGCATMRAVGFSSEDIGDEPQALKRLAVDHDYYCHTANFFSNEAGMQWDTMTDFLEEFEDADIGMNLCFRWDIRPRSEWRDDETEGYCAEVFIIQQRKGIFLPNVIEYVTEEEAERFEAYVQRHWEYLQDLWRPVSESTKGEDQ